MSNAIQISDNCPDGCVIGLSATSKVGMFGHAPVVQQAAAPVVTGASNATQMAAAITAISLTLSNIGAAA